MLSMAYDALCNWLCFHHGPLQPGLLNQPTNNTRYCLALRTASMPFRDKEEGIAHDTAELRLNWATEGTAAIEY